MPILTDRRHPASALSIQFHRAMVTLRLHGATAAGEYLRAKGVTEAAVVRVLANSAVRRDFRSPIPASADPIAQPGRQPR